MPQDGSLHSESAWSARVAIVKADDDEGLVFGWLYQSRTKDGELVVDHSGDTTEIGVLEKATYRLVEEESRGGTEMHERTCNACAKVNEIDAVRAGRCSWCKASLKGAKPTKIATLVEAVVFTPDKKKAMGVPDGILPDATWVGLRIDRTTDKGRTVWSGVKSGRYKMLSLGGHWKRRLLEAMKES